MEQKKESKCKCDGCGCSKTTTITHCASCGENISIITDDKLKKISVITEAMADCDECMLNDHHMEHIRAIEDIIFNSTT